MTQEKSYIITESQLKGIEINPPMWRQKILTKVRNQPAPDIAGIIAELQKKRKWAVDTRSGNFLDQDMYREGIINCVDATLALLRPPLKEEQNTGKVSEEQVKLEQELSQFPSEGDGY